MKRIAVAFVKLYQKIFRPLLGSNCRYYPSCSDYMILAIDHNGFIRGLGQGLWRILRCNPYSKGGIEYPPNVNEKEV